MRKVRKRANIEILPTGPMKRWAPRSRSSSLLAEKLDTVAAESGLDNQQEESDWRSRLRVL